MLVTPVMSFPEKHNIYVSNELFIIRIFVMDALALTAWLIPTSVLMFCRDINMTFPALNCLNVRHGIYFGIIFRGHPDFTPPFNRLRFCTAILLRKDFPVCWIF